MLENYWLLFRGGDGCAVATVEPREGSSVPVLLWRISRRNERTLDLYEGWPCLYGKEELSFSGADRPVSAMLYRMKGDKTKESSISDVIELVSPVIGELARIFHLAEIGELDIWERDNG